MYEVMVLEIIDNPWGLYIPEPLFDVWDDEIW